MTLVKTKVIHCNLREIKSLTDEALKDRHLELWMINRCLVSETES